MTKTTTIRRAIASAGALILLSGCGGNSTGPSSPEAVIDLYRTAYNEGDIDTVMTLFAEESAVVGHPHAPQSVGLAELRSLQRSDMASAASTEAYEFSSVDVAGSTVTWNSRWTNVDGDAWCAEEHVAVIVDGRIVEWRFAPEPQPCAEASSD